MHYEDIFRTNIATLVQRCILSIGMTIQVDERVCLDIAKILKDPPKDIAHLMPHTIKHDLVDVAMTMFEKMAKNELRGNYDYNSYYKLISEYKKCAHIIADCAAALPVRETTIDINTSTTITTPDVEIKKKEPIRLKISILPPTSPPPPIA